MPQTRRRSEASPSEDRTAQPIRIAIVSDNLNEKQKFLDFMESYCFQAVWLPKLTDINRCLARGELNLIVFDLAGDNGPRLNMLSDIKSRSDIPVIVVACSGFDHAGALEAGADDCLMAPLSLRELVARIRAVLRRGSPVRAVPPSRENITYRFGDWQLLRQTRRLTDLQGTPTPLTAAEYTLLVAFLEAPQRPLNRELLKQVIGRDGDITDRSIDLHIGRLRRKLEAAPNAPRLIRAERGLGYIFVLPVETFASR